MPFSLILIAIVLFLAICAITMEKDMDSTRQVRQEAINTSKVITDGVTLNGIGINGIGINGISMKSLSTNGLRLNTESLKAISQNARGRALLEYIAECALEEGEELLVKEDDLNYTLTGSMGLAPEWLESPLTPVGQRWMTACLLARTNFFEVPVTISMRGRHKALNTSKAEKEDYSIDPLSLVL